MWSDSVLTVHTDPGYAAHLVVLAWPDGVEWVGFVLGAIAIVLAARALIRELTRHRDPARILGDAIRDSMREAAEARAAVEADVPPPPLPQVASELWHTRSLLASALHTALAACKPGDVVVVEVRVDNDSLLFRIRIRGRDGDAGSGVVVPIV